MRLADPTAELQTGATYGPLKVECERVLRETFGAARCTIVRPTYVFGPGDDTDRFTYWIERIARGGEVLGPTSPGLELQWVDARDLCPWMVRLAESGTRGTFNVAGPHQAVTWRGVLEAVRTQLGSDAAFRWATPQVLESLQLSLPLAAARRGRRRMLSDAAQQAGLEYRPLADTVAATRDWWGRQDPARRAAARGWPTPQLEKQALLMLRGAAPA